MKRKKFFLILIILLFTICFACNSNAEITKFKDENEKQEYLNLLEQQKKVTQEESKKVQEEAHKQFNEISNKESEAILDEKTVIYILVSIVVILSIINICLLCRNMKQTYNVRKEKNRNA